MELYDMIVRPELLVRRMYVVANHLVDEVEIRPEAPQQLDMFMDYEAEQQRQEVEEAALEKERRGSAPFWRLRASAGRTPFFRE